MAVQVGLRRPPVARTGAAKTETTKAETAKTETAKATDPVRFPVVIH